MKRGWTAKYQPRTVNGKLGATHGLRNTPIGSAWIAMLGRCLDPNNQSYHHYGARGIGVCDFLRASPHNLRYLIGDRPTPKHSIDRKNNNLGYTCGGCEQCRKNRWKKNVRWSTHKEQSNNKRTNVFVKIDGVSKTVSQWAEEKGLGKSMLFRRLKHGITGKALLAPPIDKNRYIIVDGKKIQRAELCSRLGIGKSALEMRLARGWLPNEILLPKQAPRQVHVFLK